MYATGIGLVIKGIERMDKELKKDLKSDKQKNKKVKRSSFFDRVKQFFDEDGIK